MLHSEAVPPGTLALLKKLCAHAATEGFALVGGTSLALRFGHRISVDLDFFRPEKFDNKIVSASLAADFPSFQLTNDNSNGMMCFIEDAKVDFDTYPYPLLHPFETIEGVRMMSLPEVVAMKLGAISNRGAKKDFYDLAHAAARTWTGKAAGLLCAQVSQPRHDNPTAQHDLLEDAEETETPKTLIKTTWAKVKADIQKAVRAAL